MVANTCGVLSPRNDEVHAAFSRITPGTKFTRTQIREAIQDVKALLIVHDQFVKNMQANPKLHGADYSTLHDPRQPPLSSAHNDYHTPSTASPTFEHYNAATLLRLISTPEVLNALANGTTVMSGFSSTTTDTTTHMQYVIMDNGQTEASTHFEDMEGDSWHRERCNCPVVCQYPTCAACHRTLGRLPGHCDCYKFYATHTDSCNAKHTDHMRLRTEQEDLQLHRRLDTRAKEEYERLVSARERRHTYTSCTCTPWDGCLCGIWQTPMTQPRLPELPYGITPCDPEGSLRRHRRTHDNAIDLGRLFGRVNHMHRASAQYSDLLLHLIDHHIYDGIELYQRLASILGEFAIDHDDSMPLTKMYMHEMTNRPQGLLLIARAHQVYSHSWYRISTVVSWIRLISYS